MFYCYLLSVTSLLQRYCRIPDKDIANGTYFLSSAELKTLKCLWAAVIMMTSFEISAEWGKKSATSISIFSMSNLGIENINIPNHFSSSLSIWSSGIMCVSIYDSRGGPCTLYFCYFLRAVYLCMICAHPVINFCSYNFLYPTEYKMCSVYIPFSPNKTDSPTSSDSGFIYFKKRMDAVRSVNVATTFTKFKLPLVNQYITNIKGKWMQ